MVTKINLNKKLNLGKELEKWDKYLNNISSSTYFSKLKRFIKIGDEENKFYPLFTDNMFKPFDLVDPEQLKVVILTDTIHISSGLPYGSISPNTKYKNNEIEKIERSLELQFENGLNLNFDPSLESWAMQGVLMLNTSLLYDKALQSNYKKVWRNFNTHIIKSLNKTKTGIHYIFMGNATNYYKRFININNNYCYNIAKPENVKGTIDFKAFEQVNKNIIKQNGKDEIINWTKYE